MLLAEWTKQGATVESIKHQFLADSLVPVPPREEQLRILDFIENRARELNGAISYIDREIALLLEFRARLIADAVTGKLDVREAAALLPEETKSPEAFEEVDETEASADIEGDDFELEEAAA